MGMFYVTIKCFFTAPGAPKIVNLTANSSNTIVLFVHAPYRLHSQVHKYYVRYTLDGSHYTQVEFQTIGKEGEPYVEVINYHMYSSVSEGTN